MPASALSIAFHGPGMGHFRSGFEALINPAHRITELSDALTKPGEREAYEQADVIITTRLDASLPVPRAARLVQAPAAGTDSIDVARLPPQASLCNCHGHEQAIAEYVLAALLLRHVPLAQADADLRQGRWPLQAGRPGAARTELGSSTIGLLGYGHIGKAVAHRARAFGMPVVVANRSPVFDVAVKQSFGLDQLGAFMAAADAIVVSLPLTANTTGIVGRAELAAMRPSAVVINVGRGPVIDEQALYDALAGKRIAGAVIDTWYQYPTAEKRECAPSKLDFASLPNVTMTPHMSGWTHEMLKRRQATLAENINRLADGRELLNVLRPAAA